MDQQYKVIRILAQRLASLIFTYQICRLAFYCLNHHYFPNADIRAFAYGTLYDLSAIGHINLFFIAIHLAPIQQSTPYHVRLKFAFFATNLAFIATNFIDFDYYKFTGQRSSFDLITASGMENEILGLIPSFVINHWTTFLGFGVLAYIFWRSIGSIDAPTQEAGAGIKKVFHQGILLSVALCIAFIAARGGLSKRPLRISDAAAYSNIENLSLILNTPFTVIKSINNKETLNVPTFHKAAKLDSIFNPILQIQPSAGLTKKNIVVVILESFGDENLHQGYTPFLDSLLERSLYFRNAFANGKRSIDAVPSILSGIPSMMNEPFISSRYSLNAVGSLPKILKKQGYGTFFFHGAFNGSQNFENYSKVAGFDHYYGKNEYVGPEAFDGKWGIFDEEFLQFFVRKLTSFNQPFLASIFTISSHDPYTIPNRYTGRFPKGTAPIHESIGYADYALQCFFASAAQQEWYNNTVFVLTADHSSSFGRGAYTTPIGRFRIPIAFFDPSNPALKGERGKPFQQVDILPSLLDYLNINETIITFGKPFSSKQDFVVTYLDRVYTLIQGDFCLLFDGEKATALFNWSQDPMLSKDISQSDKHRLETMEAFIKAYIQSFNSRVKTNQLTLP